MTLIPEKAEPMNSNIFLYGLLIFVLLYLSYSSCFLNDYLTNDETSRIGLRAQALDRMQHAFFSWGRGLFGWYDTVVYNFVGFDSHKVQVVRFVNFISLAAIAIVLFRFLLNKSKNPNLALLYVLFFYSQPAFHGLMAYSLQLFSNTQPAMWLSLLSFYLHFQFFKKYRLPKLLEYFLVLLVLMLAMQSTQSYAFFAMILVSGALLFESNVDSRVGSYFVISFLAFVISVLLYKWGVEHLHALGKTAYAHGEKTLSVAFQRPWAVMLNALNPMSYWSVFKFWNYSFPFNAVAPIWKLEQKIALTFMSIWSLTVLTAIYLDFKNRQQERVNVAKKWGALFVSFGFAAVFFIADSPTQVIEHRPHMTLILSGQVILVGAWALNSLMTWLPDMSKKWLQYSVGLYVLFSLFGAQADTAKNLVQLRANQLAFIKAEISAAPEQTFDELIVVLSTVKLCKYEPCGPWLGFVLGYKPHESALQRYRYALASLGFQPATKRITVVNNYPEKIQHNQRVIDWNKFVRSNRAS